MSQNGTYATREQILTADDLRYEDVFCPEWGLTVRVRSLTGSDYAQYQRSLSSLRQELRGTGRRRQLDVQIESHVEQAMLLLCALTIVDGDGNRLFSEMDLQLLGQKSHRPIARIYEVAERLSGLNEEAVEEAGKGSAPTHGDSKPSRSRERTGASASASSSGD